MEKSIACKWINKSKWCGNTKISIEEKNVDKRTDKWKEKTKIIRKEKSIPKETKNRKNSNTKEQQLIYKFDFTLGLDVLKNIKN